MARVDWRTKVFLGVCLGGAVLAFLSLVFVWRGPEWWRVFFAVTSEQNMPTWYSTAVLLTVAQAAAVVGALAFTADRRIAYRWWVLSMVFAAMSLDELAALHEQLETIGALLTDPGGIFHFVWVIPGLVLVLGVVAAVVQLARRLPARARREMYAGIAVFFGAAVGLEVLGGLVLDTIGTGWTYQFVSTTEEFAEIVGAAIVLHACLRMVDITPDPPGVSIEYVGHRSAPHES